MAGGFERNTRLKRVQLPTLTKPTGGGITSIELPKTGFLARLYLNISGSITGTLSSPNALGMSSIIKRIRVTTNSGIDLYNVSGAGYGYLLQNFLELGTGPKAPSTQNMFNTAVSATSYNLNMMIPIQLNRRDPIGLILLQNEQLQVILTVEWEADATVATGATVTGTCVPTLEFFTVPPDKADWPELSFVHQVIEDQIAIGAAGDYIYNLPRGNAYLQANLGYGISAVGADNWTRAILRINQSDILEDRTPANSNLLYSSMSEGQTRLAGVIPFDMLGSDGFGSYGSARDFINSALLTDLQVVLTTTATGTLYSVRRMLLPLQRQ
jgi:hypothetical protein